MALPCASAKRCHLFPEVFDDCSRAGCSLSPRGRAIIRELNETASATHVLEPGGTGCSESFEKLKYSILSTGVASPALHRLHNVKADFRPPSVTESGEAAFRRLLASAIGGCSLTSVDPAPGSLTVFQSSRVAPPQRCLKSSLLCVTSEYFS